MTLTSSTLRIFLYTVTSLIFIQVLYHAVFFQRASRMKSKLPVNLTRDDVSIQIEKQSAFSVYHVSYNQWRDLDVLPDTVTLVSHCSAHNLHYLPRFTQTWGGPVSLAVITTPLDLQITLDAMYSMASCFESIRRYTTFHVALQTENFVDLDSAIYHFSRDMNVPCDQLINYLKVSITGINFALDGLPYPINFLRNLGSQGAETNFVMVVDIDMLTNIDFFKHTTELLKSRDVQEKLKKMALVIPVFEMDESISDSPKTKQELRSAVIDGSVRQGYIEVCAHCHGPIDYNRWFRIQDSVVGAVYQIDYRSLWDPILLVRNGGLLYDDRFKQYGFNRISYVCELFLSGYNFSVFHPGFIVHQGFKKKEKYHREKDEENGRNFRLFKTILNEYNVKYKHSGRDCLAN
ncbi:beta-1,4-glucuronyltransferase 1-like isoform X1 [Apostichopus japonicus]|uniref:beta-1,4-glucuronyltransferase 1-like isoform X1 n=1 Tax=Stichopus japonicus TaxID=307972 RepID=UPI003AB4B88B